MSRISLYRGPQFSGNRGFTKGRLPANRGPSLDISGLGYGGAPERQDTLLDQMGQALSSDIAEIRGAEAEQRSNLNVRTQDYQKFLEGVKGEIAGIKEGNTALLGGEASDLEKQGLDVTGRFLESARGVEEGLAAGQGQARDFYQRMVEGVEGDVGRANELAEGAVGDARAYGERAIATASAAARGFGSSRDLRIQELTTSLERRAEVDLKMMESGRRPDGSIMSPAELMEFKTKTQFNVMQAVGSVAAQVNSEYDRTLAQLNMAVAELTAGVGAQVTSAGLAAAGVRLQGSGQLAAARGEQAAAEERFAGQSAQVRLALTGQGLEAERVRQGYSQLATGLRELEAQLNQSLGLASLNLRASGLTSLYEMVRDNPRRAVSTFSSLMQLAMVATAPGGRGARAIQGLDFLGGGR